HALRPESGCRRGIGYGRRHSRRTSGAHLRSVLHDEADRPRDGPRPVHHLRHRAGARRHTGVRQRAGQRHAVHVDVAAGPCRADSCRRSRALRTHVPFFMPRPGTAGNILVIDDEEIMREILETLLTREGYAVRTAPTAGEGLELARAMSFDAVVLD